MIETPDGDVDEDSSLNVEADWDISATGNNLIVDVTGVTARTLNWVGQATYVKVT